MPLLFIIFRILKIVYDLYYKTRINFVNINSKSPNTDCSVNQNSAVYAQSGVLSGELITNLVENSSSVTKTLYINAFQTLYLNDGIITFNIARKYSPNDPSIYDTIITKPTYVSGAYSKYRDSLEIRIEGIPLEDRSILFKFTLRIN